jgi:hypothetical protein
MLLYRGSWIRKLQVPGVGQFQEGSPSIATSSVREVTGLECLEEGGSQACADCPSIDLRRPANAQLDLKFSLELAFHPNLPSTNTPQQTASSFKIPASILLLESVLILNRSFQYCG